MPRDQTQRENVGRYIPIKELGRGAAGRVLLARDPRINRLVALKIFDPLAACPELEEEFRRRFAIEARAAGRLSHPGIVAVHDAGLDPASGLLFIAMEFVDGPSLESFLRDRRPTSKAIIGLGVQVATALDYAHRHGVYHRDIKPANILFTGRGHAKLADFGIAKVTGNDLTLAGTVVGTPSYMSPEHIAGREIDGRSDIFSLGMVLWECLAGSNPFLAETVPGTIQRILAEDAPDLSVPPQEEGLAAVIRQATARGREQRFETAADLASALRHVQVSAPPQVAAPAPAARAAERDLDATDATILTPRPVANDAAPRSAFLATGGTSLASTPSNRWKWIIWPVGALGLLLTALVSLNVLQQQTTQGASGSGYAAAQLQLDLAESAHLTVLYDNRLEDAVMTVWVDGRKHWTKELGPLAFKQRLLGQEIRVDLTPAPGVRNVQVRLYSEELALETTNRTQRRLEVGNAYVLRVDLDEEKRLKLTWT